MREKLFSSGTKNPNPPKITFFKRENQSTQIYKRGEVFIRGFELNTVYVLFFRAVNIHLESAIKKKFILVISYLLEFIENLKP